MKLKPFIISLICLAVLISFSSGMSKAETSKKVVKNKTSIVTQDAAIKKILKYDKKITRLIPSNKTNTISRIVEKYEKDYYMFLVDYGTKEEEYTSETMYLVNKMTGAVYTLEVDGLPKQVSSTR